MRRFDEEICGELLDQIFYRAMQCLCECIQCFALRLGYINCALFVRFDRAQRHVGKMGELCLSPVGLSLVTKLAPLRFASLLMGTWFLANALANFTAGFYSGYFGHISNVQFFTWLVIMPVCGGLILLSIKKFVIKWMNGIQ